MNRNYFFQTVVGPTSAAIHLAGIVIALPIVSATGNLLPLPLPMPGWEGEAGAFHLSHTFTTSALNPVPERGSDSIAFVLSEVFVDAPFGTGWADPLDPNQHFTRAQSGGAWDLGPGGWISILIPLPEVFDEWPGPGGDLEFFVNVVAYDGFAGAPSLAFDGMEETPVRVNDLLLESDLPFGSWRVQSWSANLVGFEEEAVTLRLLAHPGQSSLVDTVEVFIIPEPATYGVLFGSAALSSILWRQRRRRVPGK